MKNIFKKVFIVITLVVICIVFGFTTTKAQETVKIYFFYGTGCPHCAVVEEYFQKNQLFDKYPIEKKDVYANHDDAEFFTSKMDELEIPVNSRGVPAVIIGKKILIGDSPIIDNFILEADNFLDSTSVQNESSDVKGTNSNNTKADLTILAVIGGALVDAINPCEFAVLIILMSTILATGKAKKALYAGLAFSASIFISYFLMGLGLYSALGIGNLSHWFYKIIGWLAVVLGLFNLKDYFWYGKGFLMEVPLSWRPKLKSLVNSITSPVGAFTVGFLVSLFLLPCTGGPYVIILGMLAKKAELVKTILYLILYNLIFVSPMV
ncbi:MAG: cytochrome c biogenesis protein, partial [Bacteroidales bacterium]|nr:cytochrome c biogenesis protein [Bacteroidales bacterium]